MVSQVIRIFAWIESFPKCRKQSWDQLFVKSGSYSSRLPLQNTKEEKDLGVIIDNQLKFHNHVSSVSSKAN